MKLSLVFRLFFLLATSAAAFVAPSSSLSQRIFPQQQRITAGRLFLSGRTADYLDSLSSACTTIERPPSPVNHHPHDNDVNTREQYSISGVSYQQVAQGLDLLFPPEQLERRNAESRKDGYWPFITSSNNNGNHNGNNNNHPDGPPPEYTYGEFDAHFFAQLLDQATDYFTPTTTTASSPYDGKILCDVGSGAGRLVMAAAALHPGLKTSLGIEILPSLHQVAMDIQASTLQMASAPNQGARLPLTMDDPASSFLPLAPTEFHCGGIADENILPHIQNVNVFFIASTCMPPHVLEDIAHAIGRTCRPGTVVVTTDYELPTQRTLCPETGRYFEFENCRPGGVDGYCWVVGGTSTAYTYRLIESAAVI